MPNFEATRLPYATLVKSPERLRAYLESGGDPNAVPAFLDCVNHSVWSVCCWGRYAAGDYGQNVGPWDSKDWDERCCGTDDPGSATFCGGGRTLLHWAAIFDEHESVRILLDHGADPLAFTIKGKVPADCAFYFEAHLELQETLMNASRVRAGRDAGVPLVPIEVAAVSRGAPIVEAVPVER